MKYLIALIIILNFSCTPENSKEKEIAALETDLITLNKSQFENAKIEFGSLSQSNINTSLSANGFLDVPPQNLVTIATPFAGYLKQTSLLEGMKVKKGQLIAQLENPDFIQIQQDFLDVKSQLTYLKLELDRQQDLSNENINALKTLQKSKSEFESMKARFLGLKKKLEYMNVSISELEKGTLKSYIELFSPINGYVTQVNSNIGAYSSPSDVLFKIADTDHLHAELTIFENDISKIQINQKVRFNLANEDKERTASVYLIGREFSKDRSVRVHCHLDKEDTQMLPGMYINAIIDIDGAISDVLPQESVVTIDGNHYIFILKSKNKSGFVFQKMQIKTGNSALGKVEIIGFDTAKIKPLSIVTKGTYALLSIIKNTDEE